MDISLDRLHACPLFFNISERELPQLLERLEAAAVPFKKGAAIFWEGQSADAVGILLSGCVHIVREDCAGNRSVIAHLEAPQLFGETCAFAGIEKLPASVIAAGGCEVVFISARKLLSASRDDPRIIQNLLRTVAGKNLLLNQKIDFMSIRTTKEKLMAYLSAQAKAQGSRRFIIPYDRQALADYLGVDRSAMSTELGKLRAEGKINFTRNCFELL